MQGSITLLRKWVESISISIKAPMEWIGNLSILEMKFLIEARYPRTIWTSQFVKYWIPDWGGISEIGWAFDLDGNIWGVGRNEDGDDSGWGSRIFSAPAKDLSDWTWTEGPGIDRLCPIITDSRNSYIGKNDPNVRKNQIQRFMKALECSDMEKIYILSERLILDFPTTGRFVTDDFYWQTVITFRCRGTTGRTTRFTAVEPRTSPRRA